MPARGFPLKKAMSVSEFHMQNVPRVTRESRKNRHRQACGPPTERT